MSQKTDPTPQARPDDRPKPAAGAADEDPRIFVVVDGRKFPRPALETFFARPLEERPAGCSCHPVVGIYCKCNKVYVGAPACGCVGHTSGGGTRVGCRCAPVH